MKKNIISCLVSMSFLATSAAYADSSVNDESVVTSLPYTFESEFQKSMNDPNVSFYYADTLFRKGDYDASLEWMLETAKYSHSAAIENVKFMIKNNLGTKANRKGVVEFLEYFAMPRGDQEADVFAQVYLADYYRGDTCVWLNDKEKPGCVTDSVDEYEPTAATDLVQSYFYYESAANRGDTRSKYTVGMMNLLGIGAPRNVPLAISWLQPLAENGNVSVAFILGSIYQDGYWTSMDRSEANKWFTIASVSNHPASLMNLAKNAESGNTEIKDMDKRIHFAIESYMKIVSGVLASDVERAEAAYRLGLIFDSHPVVRNDSSAGKYMEQVLDFSKKTNNEFGVKALMWFASKKETSDLAGAVKLYKQAIVNLEELPLDVMQRHSTVYEKLAHAYGRGQDDNFERDERSFSYYMQKRHNLMSKTFIPKVEDNKFVGYSAFVFPG